MYFFDDLTNRTIPKNLPIIDIYVAGFPCQSFSSLGKQKGLKDKRGMLFFHIFDFLNRYKPKIFILENVRRLISIDNGKTFEIIMKKLNSLNYDLNHQVLNTSDYGIPQSRNRLYIVGISKKISHSKFNFPDCLKNESQKLQNFLIDKKIYNNEFLSDNQHKILKEIKINKVNINQDVSSIYNLNVSSLKWFRKGKHKICPCLTTKCDYYLPYFKRVLYPEEALLLQGLPILNLSNISDHQLYKLAGNAMSCNVIMCVILEILKVVNLK
jgi:DNA (cytosine-5)-methyltransferase 1